MVSPGSTQLVVGGSVSVIVFVRRAVPVPQVMHPLPVPIVPIGCGYVSAAPLGSVLDTWPPVSRTWTWGASGRRQRTAPRLASCGQSSIQSGTPGPQCARTSPCWRELLSTAQNPAGAGYAQVQRHRHLAAALRRLPVGGERHAQAVRVQDLDLLRGLAACPITFFGSGLPSATVISSSSASASRTVRSEVWGPAYTGVLTPTNLSYPPTLTWYPSTTISVSLAAARVDRAPELANGIGRP